MVEDQGRARPTANDVKTLSEIVRRANAGDPQALLVLRKVLDDNPQLWQHLGNVAAISQKAWIELLSNRDVLASESIRRELSQLKAELLEEPSSVIERMLADVVVGTWLELHFLRSVDANDRSRTAGQASLLLKRVESAQKRHHGALRQLVTLRKLLRDQGRMPSLKIFTAEKEAG